MFVLFNVPGSYFYLYKLSENLLHYLKIVFPCNSDLIPFAILNFVFIEKFK